jgi:hypothetical protein
VSLNFSRLIAYSFQRAWRRLSLVLIAAKRTIWSYWHQGLDSAPPLVHACLDSWRRLNPAWRIVALDRDSLAEWVDLREAVDVSRSDLTLQKISAIARLCLLRRHGGVWADPTVFCLRPLDQWLPTSVPGGFFAFRNPGRDRLMSNWFIAAEKDSALLAALHDAFIAFMNSRSFSNQNNRFGRIALQALHPVLSRNVSLTRHWLSPRLQDRLRAYPYFIFHYVFNALILTDPGLRGSWAQVPALDAIPPHRLQALARRPGGLARAIEAIDRDAWPLQKLDWRVDADSPFWSAVMRRLGERVMDHAPAIRSAAE